MGKSGKRVKIGVIIGNLESPHAYELASGISDATREVDAELILFPVMFAKSYYADIMLSTTEEYDYLNRAIFSYIGYSDCDVLIVSMGTLRFYINLDNDGARNFMNKLSGVPCIVLEDHVDGYPSVTLNNKSGLRECFKHLIEEKKCKKIGFISGNRDNFDARERLLVYHEEMEAHGLLHDESYVRYGEFTEFVENQVKSLLDEHPDLDAISFANDMMAVGGYRELKRRGLEIGTDILVSGFDDWIMSCAMEPPLTTVKVSPYQLGYTAVKQAMIFLKNNSMDEYVIDSKLIRRESSGCMNEKEMLEGVTVAKTTNNTKTYTDGILYTLRGHALDIALPLNLEQETTEFVDAILALRNNKICNYACDYMTSVKKLFSRVSLENIHLDNVFNAFSRFMQSIIANTESETGKESLLTAFYNIYAYITNHVTSEYQIASMENHRQFWYSTFITRDTLMFSADESIAIRQILMKLRDMKFSDTYIYLFKEPKTVYGTEEITKEDFYLAGYFNEKKLETYDEEERPLLDDKMREKINSAERRDAVVQYILYANEEQYGLISFSVKMSDFFFAYILSLQIGSSLKFLNLMKTQMKMRKQLEKSLEAIRSKNEQLSILSIRDDMTGLYNRRGFFEKITAQIEDTKGAMAAVMFIDMNNLKGVNDNFGHDEGDYAIISIANILRNSFREKDYIGHIGGDEFAAFCIVDEPGILHKIQKNIQESQKELNEKNGKPFYVEMSIGVKEFICKNEMNLNMIMKQADNALYESKRKKRASCIKKITE